MCVYVCAVCMKERKAERKRVNTELRFHRAANASHAQTLVTISLRERERERERECVCVCTLCCENVVLCICVCLCVCVRCV